MLVNKTKLPLTVPIVLANGRKDTINLHSKAELPPGAKIDPQYAKQFEASIRVVDARKG